MPNLAAANTGKVVLPGLADPLGAHCVDGGVNFSVYSRDAIGMELVLFDNADSTPTHIIPFSQSVNRTYHYWHLFVPGLRTGQTYGYRARGPANPDKRMRFDPEKVLLDPYGRGVAVPANYSRDAAVREGDNASTAMKSVVVDVSAYDWEGDAPDQDAGNAVDRAAFPPVPGRTGFARKVSSHAACRLRRLAIPECRD